MAASANVVVDLEKRFVVSGNIIGLHLWVSAVAKDVARGVSLTGGVGARAYGAAAVRSRAVGCDVRDLDDLCFGCSPECAVADIKDLSDHMERALAGVPHMVAHCKQGN